MAGKSKSKTKGSGRMLPVLHPDAAGVDIGAEEIYVAVPSDRDAEPVRSFETFTRNLHQLADWLQKCRVRTVAMESTGVYWIPLYQILEARGFQVFLVGYRFYQKLIFEVDQELELKMQELPRAEGAPEQMPPRTKAWIYQRAGNEPAFDLKAELFRIAGVDLTDVPGISSITAHTILMEVGPDVSRFRNASAFASWLGSARKNRSVEARSFPRAPER